MQTLITVLILAMIFAISSCTVNIAININAPNCLNGGSSTTSTNCPGPTCDWCFNNCSSTCANSCVCTQQKCLANQTRYDFHGQLYLNTTLQGYIELIAFDQGGNDITLNGTLFTFVKNGNGNIGFSQLSSGTPSAVQILGVSSICGSTPFPNPPPASITIARSDLTFFTTGITQVTITFPTVTLTGVLMYTTTEPPGSIAGAESFLVASQNCVDLTSGLAVGTTTCTNLGGIFVDLQADPDCTPATARVICYTGSASAAKFSCCTTQSASAACQQTFPGFSNATSVYQTSINCLNQNLSGASRYLCVVPN